jgi:tetratricopeptide (TPR) repeat protein
MSEETNRQILEELRSMHTLARKYHKANMVAVAILGVFVIAFLVTIPLRHRLYSHGRSPAETVESWHQARTLLDQGEMEKGKQMIERLLLKYPNYYYGHSLLGSVYQEMGNPEAAEKCYSRAVDLFPDEDNEKILAAIRKAIQRKNQTANQASEAIGAPGAPQPQR